MNTGIKTAVAEDMKMNYISFGNGRPMVILPGISLKSVLINAGGLEDAFASFTSAFTVYVFDRESDFGPGYSIGDMADDTAKAMKVLGLENACVFGASQGGMIALILAARYPKLVSKVVAASTSCRETKQSEEVIRRFVELARKKDAKALTASCLQYFYSKKTLELYSDALMSQAENVTDAEFERFATVAHACIGFDFDQVLPLIKCPVLAIGSEGDLIFGAQPAREIARATGGDCYIYPDSFGHAVYDEAPDFRPRMLEFFTRRS